MIRNKENIKLISMSHNLKGIEKHTVCEREAKGARVQLSEKEGEGTFRKAGEYKVDD